MEKRMQKPVTVGILALICCFFWGSAFPCVKIGYEWLKVESTGSQILFAGYRFFLAGVFTFVIGCVLEKRILKMKWSSLPYIAGQGFLQTTVQYLFFSIGLAHTTGAKGSIICGSNGLMAIIAAHFIMKSEKMTVSKWLGCVLGLAGVVAVNLSPGAWGEGFNPMGEGLIMICAVTYGLSSVTLKLISHRESPMVITAYQLLIGSTVLIVAGLVMGGKVSGFNIQSSLLMLYLALLSTIAFSLWAVLMKYNPVGRISIYLFTVPVFGVVLSGILLGETIFSVKNMIALILVSIGIIIVNKGGAKTAIEE